MAAAAPQPMIRISSTAVCEPSSLPPRPMNAIATKNAASAALATEDASRWTADHGELLAGCKVGRHDRQHEQRCDCSDQRSGHAVGPGESGKRSTEPGVAGGDL